MKKKDFIIDMEGFDVDSRVSFNIDGTEELTGTGKILGKGIEGFMPMFIVLLDKPIAGQKALLIQRSLIKKAELKMKNICTNPNRSCTNGVHCVKKMKT